MIESEIMTGLIVLFALLVILIVSIMLAVICTFISSGETYTEEDMQEAKELHEAERRKLLKRLEGLK